MPEVLRAKSSAEKFSGAVLSFFSLIFFLALVWLPEFDHYRVPRETITPVMIEYGRKNPAEAVISEMRFHRLLEHDWQSQEQMIAAAEELLIGKVQIGGVPATKIHVPFDPADLERGTGQWQLQFAGFVVPEILIDAYRATAREEFYAAARDTIVGWAKFEKHAWMNHGFLWNDHAVATRVRTLADFWDIYRRRPDYRPEIAQEIWEFAARSGALLAKPDQYTVATNHGVMQNIALWQLSLAFPSLPRAKEYRQLALARLKGEMAFYVAPDGAVLEHSADYHAFGLYLFGMALRYTTLLKLDAPGDWDQKYERAKQFYAELLRPDGTLPAFGDTAVGLRHKPPEVTKKDEDGGYSPLAAVAPEAPADGGTVYPVSGYAIVWDRGAPSDAGRNVSQTVLAWSHFAGHGHKHADEPSVSLWSGGQEWWTNAGYWSYDDDGRAHAECWEGSNAPHLTGEKCNSRRKASLIGSIDSHELFAAEIERAGPGDLRVRRLVVHLKPSAWVIVDYSDGASQNNLETVWTTAADVRLEDGGTPGSYTLAGERTGSWLRGYLLGPPAMAIRNLRGSRDPFAGWLALEGKPTPTNAIVTTQPTQEPWAATVWVLDGDSQAKPERNSAASVEWKSPQTWNVRVPMKNGSLLLTREGDRISASENGASEAGAPILEALRPTGIGEAAEIESINANFEAEARKYPRFRELYEYRVRASVLGVALLLLQELFFGVCRRWRGKHLLILRAASLAGWVVLCFWVWVFYLA
jgi:Heparinase II/III N-terminus/Heparinase II/III-like protein